MRVGVPLGTQMVQVEAKLKSCPVSKHNVQEGPLYAVCLGGRSPTAHIIILRLHLI